MRANKKLLSNIFWLWFLGFFVEWISLKDGKLSFDFILPNIIGLFGSLLIFLVVWQKKQKANFVDVFLKSINTSIMVTSVFVFILSNVAWMNLILTGFGAFILTGAVELTIVYFQPTSE